MTIQSTQQLENTRRKLQKLESRLEELAVEPVVNPGTRELTRRSLKKLVNQLKEEIARFESRAPGSVGEERKPARGQSTSTTPGA